MIRDELKTKRDMVLTAIKPICEAFNIDDYDYHVYSNGQELLMLNGTYIGCSGNSVSAVVDELIGYIFIKVYCRNRSLGAFEKQTQNFIKRHWTIGETVFLACEEIENRLNKEEKQ